MNRDVYVYLHRCWGSMVKHMMEGDFTKYRNEIVRYHLPYKALIERADELIYTKTGTVVHWIGLDSGQWYGVNLWYSGLNALDFFAVVMHKCGADVEELHTYGYRRRESGLHVRVVVGPRPKSRFHDILVGTNL